MKQAIRVAILGAGYMAGVHARNLQKVEGVSIAAVCDSDGERAAQLAQACGGESVRPWTDDRAMLAAGGFDALYLCVPPFAHDGQLEAAARNGCHVFVEKPIALSVERAESMVEAVRAAGVVSQVGYHGRFGHAVRAVRRMMEDGAAGRPVLFDGRYDCNSLHGAWWRDRGKSGGQVFEQAIHVYDMALHLLGEAASISGHMANLCHSGVPGYTVEDNSVSAIRFRSGALGSIAATNCAVPMEWNFGFSVFFEHMTAHFRDPNHAEIIRTAGGHAERVTIGEDIDMYEAEDRAFIAAIRGEAPQTCPVSVGLAGLRLVDAVVRSADQGGMIVRLDEA